MKFFIKIIPRCMESCQSSLNLKILAKVRIKPLKLDPLP